MLPKYAKPAGCTGCALERLGTGFGQHVFPDYSKILFVGEALGADEVWRGEPFQGGAGAILSRICHTAGVDRSTVGIANVVACQPPGNLFQGMPWEFVAASQCRQYLQPMIDRLPANGVIVPLGATAMEAILGLQGQAGVTMKDFHHTVSRDPSNRFWVVPTFHPSHLQRGAMNLFQVAVSAVAKAAGIAQSGFVRSLATLAVDPDPVWFHAWVVEHLRRVHHDPDGTWLALDTEFPEKAGGVDESEVTSWGRLSPITRVNFCNDGALGFTVPYREPYRQILEQLLAGLAQINGIVLLWNKYADWEHLQIAGHTLSGITAIDLMWAWHYLQSDLPRGLGFVAAMASDFGPWKHWAKIKEQEGPYAAADGLQTHRCGTWIISALIKAQMWEMFLSDWHDRDSYVLRPAHEQGVPVNRAELVAFHEWLQGKQALLLDQLKKTDAQGTLRPKFGYAKRPQGARCPACDGSGRVNDVPCLACAGCGRLAVHPPSTILGKPKRGGGEAKSAYMLEEITLVEKAITVTETDCTSCGAAAVGPKHRCPLPRRANAPRGTRRAARAVAAAAVDPALAPVAEDEAVDAARPVARLVPVRRVQRRYFWKLPFNPDAPQQILAYLESKGIAAPVDKKRRDPLTGEAKKTTNKAALKDLASKHADDPFFQTQLDWKAVTKIDATYAIGTLSRLDSDDRIHPEFLPKPSTLRDSCVGPNLQNVVADKTGPEALAAGFRRVIEARDGLPPTVTEAEYTEWARRWAVV